MPLELFMKYIIADPRIETLKCATWDKDGREHVHRLQRKRERALNEFMIFELRP